MLFVYDLCENARDNFDRALIYYVNSFKDNKFNLKIALPLSLFHLFSLILLILSFLEVNENIHLSTQVLYTLRICIQNRSSVQLVLRTCVITIYSVDLIAGSAAGSAS